MGFFNIFIPITLIASKIILASGISFLALSIVTFIKVSKKQSIAEADKPKEQSVKSETVEVDKSKGRSLTIPKADPVKIQADFIEAAKNGNTDRALDLIKNGADINKLYKFAKTALMYAAKNGHTDTVLALIGRGAKARYSRKIWLDSFAICS